MKNAGEQKLLHFLQEKGGYIRLLYNHPQRNRKIPMDLEERFGFAGVYRKQADFECDNFMSCC